MRPLHDYEWTKDRPRGYVLLYCRSKTKLSPNHLIPESNPAGPHHRAVATIEDGNCLDHVPRMGAAEFGGRTLRYYGAGRNGSEMRRLSPSPSEKGSAAGAIRARNSRFVEAPRGTACAA